MSDHIDTTQSALAVVQQQACYATLTAPDSEGWWWYLGPEMDTSDAIPVEVYIHGGTVEAWSGRSKMITSYFGKWQRIPPAQWHNTTITQHGGETDE